MKFRIILLEVLVQVLKVDFGVHRQFSRIRTEESNMGNMCADFLRSEYNVDIGLLNMGALRANSVFPKGPFKLKLIALMLPAQDKILIKKVPGRVLKNLLENSVSQYPKYDGRFSSVSGIKFSFDPEKLSDERILTETLVMEDGSPFEMDKLYSVAAKKFIMSGKDGYDDFLDESILSMPPSVEEAWDI